MTTIFPFNHRQIIFTIMVIMMPFCANSNNQNLVKDKSEPKSWLAYLKAINKAKESIVKAQNDLDNFIEKSQLVFSKKEQRLFTKPDSSSGVAIKIKSTNDLNALFKNGLQEYGFPFFIFNIVYSSDPYFDRLKSMKKSVWRTTYNEIMKPGYYERLYFEKNSLIDFNCVSSDNTFNKKCLKPWINACANIFSSRNKKLGLTYVTNDADKGITEEFREITESEARKAVGFHYWIFDNPRSYIEPSNFEETPYDESVNEIVDIPVAACRYLAEEGFEFYKFEIDREIISHITTLNSSSKKNEIAASCKYIKSIDYFLKLMEPRVSSLDEYLKKELKTAVSKSKNCK